MVKRAKVLDGRKFGVGLVMALLLLGLSVVPAFGQAADVQYNNAVCQNIIGDLSPAQAQYLNLAVSANGGTAIADASGGDQYGGNGGTAIASANGGEIVVAIAQEQNVSVEQVNNCLNTIIRVRDETGGDDNNNGNNNGGNNAAAAGKVAVASQYPGKANVIVSTIPKKALPVTGGISLYGLVAIGLVAIVVGSSVLRAAIRRGP
jgi:hypothetical protein